MLTLRRRITAEQAAAKSLYDWAVARARQPELFASRGVPDTVEGRFEALTFHIVLLIDRLKGGGPSLDDTRQAVFDLYIRNLDGALREMGVGDLAVGKRMKSLGKIFYGRARALEAAFASANPREALRDFLERTVLFGNETAKPGLLADYVVDERARLARRDNAALARGLVD